MAEQAGRVRIAKPDGTLPTFLNISTKVDASGERGLQAIAFDPGFSTNRYVYLHYTSYTSTTPVHNRVVRVTASGDKIVAGSEKLIFRLGNQTSEYHLGGALTSAQTASSTSPPAITKPPRPTRSSSPTSSVRSCA